jgi:hypothetical protein
MVLVREAVPQDWQALCDIRLAALRDAPDAFGSTYEAQAAYVEADWQRRISRGGTFLAYVPEVCASEHPLRADAAVKAATSCQPT